MATYPSFRSRALTGEQRESQSLFEFTEASAFYAFALYPIVRGIDEQDDFPLFLDRRQGNGNLANRSARVSQLVVWRPIACMTPVSNHCLNTARQ